MTASTNNIRYAVRAARHLMPPLYLSRTVGLVVEGNVSRLADAKTFASPDTAQQWLDRRGDWRQQREQQGYTVAIVPVRMARGSKTVVVGTEVAR